MLTPAELKSFLREHGLRLTKRRGQHHLIDARIIAQLIDRCELSQQDVVVEIGAGLGALTEVLAQRVREVIAVEVDRAICELLRERMTTLRLTNVRVVCQDILTFPWNEVRSPVVVGAIPYSITSPILVALSEHRAEIRKAVLILQEEVAERLLAAPSTKAYGRLSILAQYSWELTSVMTVARSAFFPQPEVDSRCLRLLPRAVSGVTVDNEAAFFELVKAAFAHRRKSLLNALRSAYHDIDRSQMAQVLHTIQVSPSTRGEELSLEQFAALSHALRLAKKNFLSPR